MQQSGKSPPLCDTLPSKHFMRSQHQRWESFWVRERLERGLPTTPGHFSNSLVAVYNPMSPWVSRRTSWHATFLQKRWPGGSRGSHIPGSIPSLVKWQAATHTPQNTLNTETLSPQRPDWDLCVCGCLAAETTTPLRGFQNPLWIIPRPSSSTSSQAQVDGGKACRSSWGWESVRVPSSVGKKKKTEETGEQEHTWAVTRVLADDGRRAAEDSRKPGRASPLRAWDWDLTAIWAYG